jgi:hypothetical protein
VWSDAAQSAVHTITVIPRNRPPRLLKSLGYPAMAPAKFQLALNEIPFLIAAVTINLSHPTPDAPPVDALQM